VPSLSLDSKNSPLCFSRSTAKMEQQTAIPVHQQICQFKGLGINVLL
jgi:hypothetical protein